MERAIARTQEMPGARPEPSPVLRYGVAVAVTLAAIGISLLFQDYIQRTVFIFFFGAVAVAAWYGGLGPGLVATVLGVVLVDYFLIPPLRRVSLGDPADLAPLAAFSAFALLISSLTNQLRLSRERVGAQAVELATFTRQLQDQTVELEQQTEEAQVLAEELEDAKHELEERATEQLAEAQAIAHLGSWEWDVGLDRITWSDELYRIYGYRPGEVDVTYDSFLDHVHPEDRAHVGETVGEGLRTQQPFEFEHRILRPSGEVRLLYARGRVAATDSGAPSRMVGIALDVTEQRRAESETRLAIEERAGREASEAARRRLALLAEASQLLASTLEYEATLKTVARLAVPAFADWSAVDLVGAGGEVRRLAAEHVDPSKAELVRTLRERWPERPGLAHGLLAVVRGGRTDAMLDVPDEAVERAARDEEHLRVLRGLGFHSYIIAPLVARGRTLGAFSVVYAESGRRYGPEDVAFVEDLARRAAVAIDNARLLRETAEARDRLRRQAEVLQQAQEEMAVANEDLRQTTDELLDKTHALDRARSDAEAANRAKSEFLAMMSHELRTPLNAIAGYTELMEIGIAGPVSEQQLDYLTRIRRSQRHLLGLINDVLNFAKLEAGRVQFQLEDVAVAETLREVEMFMEPQLRAKALRYTLALPEPAPAVRADREKLQQVLLNLLSNAVKFTEPGGAIAVECERIAAPSPTLAIRVRDTGIGIPPDRLAGIFEPFVQVGRTLQRAQEGTGLGLAISRELAEAMDGDLRVESEVGVGSTFTFTVPLAG